MTPKKKKYSRSAGVKRVGILHVSKRGDGFLLEAGEDGEDLFIYRANLKSAMDGDEVEAELSRRPRGDLEGSVTRILRRAHTHVVGQMSRVAGIGVVEPRNKRLNCFVEVEKPPSLKEAPDRAWVRVAITQYSSSKYEPLQGQVEEVLGTEGEKGVEVLALLRDMGVETEFPEAALREAKALPDAVAGPIPPNRVDLRHLAICTIDPKTAKDFDDALSIEKGGVGHWRLGVHIADVAEYVQPETALDQEGRKRATSIYPVDRVVPMLPEKLSNGLCSLRPKEDRNAMTVFMEVSREGEVLEREVVESVIHSRHRLHYQEVQDFFDYPEKRQQADFASITRELLELRELARALNAKRIRRGAIDFDMPETDIVCNPGGETLDVCRHERLESHRLVEECMLLANETLAEFMGEKSLPLLYRNHDLPDPEALKKMGPALACFGIKVPKKFDPRPAFYQDLVARIGRREGAHIAQRLILRTMAQAEYRPDNRGHFGLASRAYCHFTSPIRRYSDLMTHRVLKDYLRGKTEDPDYLEAVFADLPGLATHCNVQSDEAESIEREAGDIKAMEYMTEHLGEVHEGLITGVIGKGLFIELLPWPVEGMLPTSALPHDVYRPDAYNTRLRGRHTGKSFRLGQKVRVQIAQIRLNEGEMDFSLPGVENRRKKKGKHYRRKHR